MKSEDEVERFCDAASGGDVLLRKQIKLFSLPLKTIINRIKIIPWNLGAV